jgi:hypothetical protein
MSSKNKDIRHGDQTLAEMIQAGCEILWPEIHKLINSILNKKEL